MLRDRATCPKNLFPSGTDAPQFQLVAAPSGRALQIAAYFPIQSIIWGRFQLTPPRPLVRPALVPLTLTLIRLSFVYTLALAPCVEAPVSFFNLEKKAPVFSPSREVSALPWLHLVCFSAFSIDGQIFVYPCECVFFRRGSSRLKVVNLPPHDSVVITGDREDCLRVLVGPEAATRRELKGLCCFPLEPV